MGLFSSISKVVKQVAKPIVKVLPKPVAKPIAKVIATGTALLADPKKLLAVAAKGPVLGPIEALTASLAPKAAPAVSFATSLATSVVPGGQTKMALDIGGILKGVSGIFGGGQNPIFDTLSGITGTASQFFPAANPMPTSLAVRPAMAPALPAIRAVGTMVGRTFFQKYPNLATSIQQLRARGHNVKRSQLWNLMKRFGPELVVSGGLLTAAAVSELMVAGPGRRSMNPANPKALRRAARRIKGFHKMCGTIDLLKSRGRRTSRSCGTCHRNPCRC